MISDLKFSRFITFGGEYVFYTEYVGDRHIQAMASFHKAASA